MSWTLIVHVHTKHSPDSLTEPRALVRHAVALGVDVLAVTDHNTWRGAVDALGAVAGAGLPLRVIVASEVHTDQGDVIGLFLQDDLRPARAPTPGGRAGPEASPAGQPGGGPPPSSARWPMTSGGLGPRTRPRASRRAARAATLRVTVHPAPHDGQVEDDAACYEQQGREHDPPQTVEQPLGQALVPTYAAASSCIDRSKIANMLWA